MMSRRYCTRSTTPVIDLTGDTETMPIRVRKPRRSSVLLPAPIPESVSQPTVVEERTVKTHNDSDKNDRKVDDGNKVATLPCLNNSFNGIPEIMTCSICFGAMSASSKPTATRCGHVFCGTCLEIVLGKRQRCPTCQSIAKLSTSIRLYF